MKLLVMFAAVFAVLAVMVSGVSAFASVDSVEVNGVEALNGAANVAAFSGDTLPVRVIFYAFSPADDVRVKAWIAGEQDLAVSSERFDVVAYNTYARMLNIQVPSDLDLSENLELVIGLENRESGFVTYKTVTIAGQRESYNLDVLDVDVSSKAVAGENLAFDIVLKNSGIHLAEDAFVRVSIPALGISEKAYFGDLSSEDQVDPDYDDSVERRLYLAIPTETPSGVYVVEVEAYNADSIAQVTRKVAVVGASDDTLVVSPSTSKTFSAGDNAAYSLTVVNRGNEIRVYDFSFETSSGLTVEAADSVLIVPAGTSKTATFNVVASENGNYDFAVNVNSNGELVEKVSFTAEVKGSSVAGNATVLLTVILAIIFVVLLVVLIILLTRKPEKAEEFGESYY